MTPSETELGSCLPSHAIANFFTAAVISLYCLLRTAATVTKTEVQLTS